MSTLLIQARDADGDWCKVTSYAVPHDHQPSKPKRRAAIAAAFRGLCDWRSSDQFTGERLRVVESHGYDRAGKALWRELTGVAS